MVNPAFSDKQIDELRADFPHTKQGHIYLNHAAISPLSTTVKKALDRYLQERNAGAIENFEQGMILADETRKNIAEYIHAPAPETISFTGNTSDGISAVAEGLDWQPGDQIILNTMEFPANVQPFRMLEQKGVDIVYIKPADGTVTAGMLEEVITPKTKMISISAVQYLTGFKADLAAIGDLCRQQNIFFVVDGIQALKAYRIDVQKANIDALATGGHKWLMGPMGIGFLYLSEKLARELKPYKTGWLSVEEPWDLQNFNQKWLPVSQHLETGTPNMVGIMEIGPDKVSHRIQQLSNYIVKSVSENSAFHLLTPQDENLRAGIVSFSSDHQNDPEKTIKQLKEKNITFSAREGYFRLSPHFYNTEEEIDIALQAIG